MTADMWLTLGILAVAILLFVTEWVRVDIVALGVVVALMLTGVLTTSEALAGFSSTAVLLIAALFIVGGAVFQTGLANTLANQIIRIAGTNETRLIVVVMVSVAIMSAFISNTGTVAVLLPAVISIAVTLKISPSRLLIPLAFASSLGGAATLIGTPPNIIVSEALGDAGFEPFQFFSFVPMGIILIAVGTGFMLVMRQFLPDNRGDDDAQAWVSPEELLQQHDLPDKIYRVRIRKASSLVDKAIGETRIGGNYGIDILEISRPAPPRTIAALGAQSLVIQSDRNIPIHPRPETVLQRDDILIVRATEEAINRASAALTLAIQPHSPDDQDALISQEVGVAEVVLPPRSAVIGKSLVDLAFSNTYNLNVLDINRPGRNAFTEAFKHEPLQFGDILLVQGEWRNILALKKQPRDFVLIGSTENIEAQLLNRRKAPIALLILLGLLVVLVTGWLSITPAALLASLLVVITGCLTMDEAYEAIDWKSIVLIAGMLPMSTAMVNVGLIDILANTFTSTLGQLGPIVVMGGLFLVTSIFTQVLSNTTTAVILAPLAVATAQSLGVAPQAFLMTIAVSASMAFATPVASPVNTLVMGAGDYRFVDYVRIGLPLIGVTFVVSMVALPFLFSF